MMQQSENIIKIVLSILFLLCLVNMPYGFYQIVRFLGFVGFGILAYQSNQKEKQTEMFVYIALAILFQPFFKIYLGRTIWNVVDVVVAVGLLLSVLTNKKEK
ncbi:hypothetical protein SAMN05660493_03098 [Epilithonimonas bovis DSM 19482]|uniref:SPW repeat-containing protein n=1 Tax=Epilithonimonas bovis DSM 19482 TaxID=1121284 RepID=A0A1U7PXS5_9FLAO|nr:hypothetical protein SAMN05660493_03098 [Epilithonimonas bovis DSM 19482]